MKPWLFPLSIAGLVLIVGSTLQTVPHKYYLITTRVTWPTAQNYCRVKYTDLATVDSGNDWARLKYLLARQSITAPFWIGLYNGINNWRWSLNEVPLKNTTFMKWGIGNPNNNYGHESCGIIGSDGYWWDAYCYDLKPFICYNDGKSGTDRFVGVTSPMMTWSDARAYCREFHTDLVTVANSTDNKLVASVASHSTSCYWTGLYRDTWMWSDGTKISNLHWATGQPNNAYKNENCGVHYNLLEDENCNNLHFFMCHTIPPVREQQMVRLQVKFDGSVSDHEAQLSILDVMKQKLEEKGMLENSTVTWRVQPDGNIFYKKKRDGL